MQPTKKITTLEYAAQISGEFSANKNKANLSKTSLLV